MLEIDSRLFLYTFENAIAKASVHFARDSLPVFLRRKRAANADDHQQEIRSDALKTQGGSM